MKTILVKNIAILIFLILFAGNKLYSQNFENPAYSYNEYRLEEQNVKLIEKYITSKQFNNARNQLNFLKGANHINYKLLTIVKLSYYESNKRAVKEATEVCFKNGLTLKEYTEFVSKFQKDIPKTQIENYQVLRQQYLKSTNQAAIKKLCKAIENSDKIGLLKKSRAEIAAANKPQEKTLDSLIKVFGGWPGVGVIGSAIDESCSSVTKILENADYNYNKKVYKNIVTACYNLTESWETAEKAMAILMKQARSESCNYIPLLYLDSESADDDFSLMMEALFKISKQDDVAEIIVYPVNGAKINNIELGLKRIELFYSDKSNFKKITFSKEKVDLKNKNCQFKEEQITYVAEIKNK